MLPEHVAGETVEQDTDGTGRDRRLFHLAPEAHVVVARGGTITDANQRAALLLGVSPDDLVDADVMDFVADADGPRLQTWMRELVDEDRVDVPECDATLEPVGRAPVRATLRAVLAGTAGSDDARLLVSIRDVGETHRARAALQAAYEEERTAAEHLRELDRWKNAFMAAAAHDLRSPLAGIRAFAETLLERDDDLTDEQRRLFLHRILHTTDRVTRLLGDLLDLDRATRDVIRPELVATDLGALVRECVAEVEPLGHTIDIDVDADTPEAPVDRLRLAQVVTNLVENAVRHTPADATVWVRVGAGDRSARVVVEDDGAGVPEEVVDRLFMPFVTAPVVEGAPGGSGIGLSLVELFVELHRGTVHHEPRPDGGARFVVELPLG